MKKTYINPTNKIYNVQTTSMTATSPTTQSMSYGGNNDQEGASLVAETKEENGWATGW